MIGIGECSCGLAVAVLDLFVFLNFFVKIIKSLCQIYHVFNL
jgi:hypothetical protein